MSKSCHVLLLSLPLSWCAVPAPSLFMFCRTLRRNLVQILFDILRWPGDIHCLLCFLWIPLFWFLSSHFRPPSLSLACWVSVARKETAFNARRVCQHLQPVCHLHCHLGIVVPLSSTSTPLSSMCVCVWVCIIHKCALVLNVNICTCNSSRGQVTIYSLCCY